METDRERQIREIFSNAAADTLVRRMGIKILEASAERVVEMCIRDRGRPRPTRRQPAAGGSLPPTPR